MNISDIGDIFSKMSKLYHYTTFEAALKIIQSGNLRFGSLYNMNDIHECCKLIYKSNDNPKLKFKTIRDEIFSYKQISLSIDDTYYGFELLPMWGLYAGKATGCCLVFNKDLLKRICKSDKILDDIVNYDVRVSSDFVCSAENKRELNEYLKEHTKEIFYNKSKLWEHEQEYRLIKRFKPYEESSLNFHDALKYVIMCRSHTQSLDIKYADDSIFSSPEYKIMSKICSSKGIPILFYGNGLNGYELSTEGGSSIWNCVDKYDVFHPEEID